MIIFNHTVCFMGNIGCFDQIPWIDCKKTKYKKEPHDQSSKSNTYHGINVIEANHNANSRDKVQNHSNNMTNQTDYGQFFTAVAYSNNDQYTRQDIDHSLNGQS